MAIIIIGIKETAPGTWRLTYNGRVLGDSHGMSKTQALMEARREASLDAGHWQGADWVSDTHMLDPELSK